MSLAARFDRIAQIQRGINFDEFRMMSMEEMEACRVGFGAAHKGKTYQEVWEAERSWRRFILTKYGLPEMEPEQRVLAQKSKAKAKAQMRPTEADVANGVRALGCDGQERGRLCELSSHEWPPGSGVSDGECHAGSPAAPSSVCKSMMQVDHIDLLEGIKQAGDGDHNFDAAFLNTQIQGFRKELEDVFHLITAELVDVIMSAPPVSSRLRMLEVYCSDQSELTKHMNNLGYRASTWICSRRFVHD